MDGEMASIGFSTVNTCYQELLAEVEENGEGIQEIIDVLGWGSSGGGDAYTPSQNGINF